jgi:hypothetical protein
MYILREMFCFFWWEGHERLLWCKKIILVQKPKISYIIFAEWSIKIRIRSNIFFMLKNKGPEPTNTDNLVWTWEPQQIHVIQEKLWKRLTWSVVKIIRSSVWLTWCCRPWAVFGTHPLRPWSFPSKNIGNRTGTMDKSKYLGMITFHHEITRLR